MIRRAFPYFFLLLGLLLFLCHPAVAAIFMDVSFNLTVPEGKSHHGYAEYQLDVENFSTTRARTIQVSAPNLNYGYSTARVHLTAQVPPNTKKRLFFWHPPINLEGGDLSLLVDGYKWPDHIPFKPYEHCSDNYYGSRGQPPVILVSNSLSLPSLNFPEPVKKTSYHEEKDLEIIRSDLPVGAWSQNWLGYTRYDGILLTATDFVRMPPTLRTTMERFVETGGLLLVFGPVTLPRAWQRWSHLDFGGFSAFIGGFGVCMVRDGVSNSAGLSQGEAASLVRILKKRLTQLAAKQTPEAANRSFPVISGTGVPVRGMLVLMLLYAIVVGPINLLYLARFERKTWILWTVPVISLVTSGVVFFYAIFGEGFWGVKCRLAGVTYLDENTRRSASLAWLGLYSTLSIGEGLHFQLDTEATPQVSRSSYRAASVFRSFDWSKDQNMDEGWVSSRVPIHFRIRNTQHRRERLTLKPLPNNRLGVVNGLGAHISRLILIDHSGNRYHGASIPPGADIELSGPITDFIPSNSLRPDGFFQGFSDDWLSLFTRTRESAPSDQLRGRYLAVLDGAPFIETGLPNTRGDITSTVLGVLKINPEEPEAAGESNP
jgi:hypothetical protein